MLIYSRKMFFNDSRTPEWSDSNEYTVICDMLDQTSSEVNVESFLWGQLLMLPLAGFQLLLVSELDLSSHTITSHWYREPGC
jgi:hypothetical protein